MIASFLNHPKLIELLASSEQQLISNSLQQRQGLQIFSACGTYNDVPLYMISQPDGRAIQASCMRTHPKIDHHGVLKTS